MNDKRKPISLVIKNIETEEECEKLFEERKKRKEKFWRNKCQK